MGCSTSTRSRCSSARRPMRIRRTSICWCASGTCAGSTRTRSRTTISCRCPWGPPPVPERRAATASRAGAADKRPQTGGARLRLRRSAVTRHRARAGVEPRHRLARQARAPSEASAASPARAKTNLFASTTAVLTTTSGRSSTSSRNRRPAWVRPLGERVRAAAAPRLPAQAASAGEAVHPIAVDQRAPGVRTVPGPAALAPSRADSPEERPRSSRCHRARLAAASEFGRLDGAPGRWVGAVFPLCVLCRPLCPCSLSEVPRDRCGGECRNDEQADADRRTPQQQITDAEERGVDEHAAQARIQHLASE